MEFLPDFEIEFQINAAKSADLKSKISGQRWSLLGYISKRSEKQKQELAEDEISWLLDRVAFGIGNS